MQELPIYPQQDPDDPVPAHALVADVYRVAVRHYDKISVPHRCFSHRGAIVLAPAAGNRHLREFPSDNLTTYKHDAGELSSVEFVGAGNGR